MAVTTHLEDSNGTSGGLEDPGIDAWVLCAEFVEKIVSDALSEAARQGGGRFVPEVDRVAIWRAGDGAPSDEAAIGRIVRAASEAARGIAPGTAESFTPPLVVGRTRGASVPESDLISRSPAGDDPFALMAPFAASVAALNRPFEPSAPRVEPDAAAVAPNAGLLEPITAPVPVILAPERRVLDDTDQHRVSVGSATRTHAGWVTVFTWIRNVGAIMLLFVVWQLWGTAISQHHDQSELQSAFEATVRAHHVPKTTKPTLIPASAFVASGGDGSVVAHLQIPAIGVDQYVVEGTSSTDLAKGPGHYVGTAMPGQAGNVAIAGHRTTHGAPFNRLGQLVSGDRISVTTTSGQNWTYVVSGPPSVVSPHDVTVLNYFGDNRITLTTCNPEYSASQRLVVVGTLKQTLATPAARPKHLTYHVVSPATASWDWSLLPAVGLEVCLLALLGLSYRRFRDWFGPTGRWLILVPLWAAGLFLLFTTLTSFLPAAY